MITLQHEFPESTSRTQTHEIEIEKLKEISSVSVNTGYVSVVSVVDDLVTLQFASGTYSRRVLRSGSYTPSDSKQVTYERFSVSYRFERWNGTSWVHAYDSSMPDPPATYNYNVDGYSGTLSKYGAFVAASGWIDYDSPYPSNPKVGDTKNVSFRRYVQRYTGTVTRPASDTRVYRYYYQYTATINYLEKSLNIVYKTDGELRDAYQGWVLIDNELREIDNMKKLVDGELREC